MRIYQAKELCGEIKKAIQSAIDKGQYHRAQQLKIARKLIKLKIQNAYKS